MDSPTTTPKIGVETATIIGMNAMIGSGIFTAPAVLASHVGPAGILAYIFVVISVWFMGMSLARLSALYPEEGSFYIYAKQWGGHIIGLFAGFCYFLGLIIAMGLLSQMIGKYLSDLFPIYTSYTWGLITLIVLTILNMFGVVLSQLGQHILIVTTIFPLLATTLICFLHADFNNLIPFAPYGFTNVFKATREVIFSFFGFECAASLFNIVRDPQKNVPRALTYSIVIVGVIYILFVASIIVSTPLSYFTSPDILLPTILKQILPNHPWLITIIHISILSAMVGTVHSMIWSSSALLVTLIKKIYPRVAIPPSYEQTGSVIVIGCGILLSFLLLKNLALFFNLTATFIVTANLLSMITLLTLKSEWISGNNIKTIIGFLTGSLILYFALEGLIYHVTL